MSQATDRPEQDAPQRRDRTHFLYIAVIVAVVLGIAVGFLAPDFGAKLKPIGDAFVARDIPADDVAAFLDEKLAG